MPDYYEVLNLPRGAGSIALEQAYERLVGLYRGNEAALRQVQEAYFTLSNPLSRKRYDQTLANAPSSPAAPAPTAPVESHAPPKRAHTELIEVSSSGVWPPGASPPAVTHSPAELKESDAPPTRRAVTEFVETMVNVRPAGRPVTEVVDVSRPSGAPTPRPLTDHIEHPAPPAGARPVTDYITSTAAPGAAVAGPARPVPLGPFRVVVTQPNNAPFDVQLGEGKHILGRPSKNGPEPAVKLPNPFVSREHATLIKEANTLVIVDNHSINGTRLNGQRLVGGQPYPLEEADQLEIEDFVLRVVFS